MKEKTGNKTFWGETFYFINLYIRDLFILSKLNGHENLYFLFILATVGHSRIPNARSEFCYTRLNLTVPITCLQVFCPSGHHEADGKILWTPFLNNRIR
jgi:hypothetical protein